MMKKETLRSLLNVAKGRTPPDCVIRKGKLVNVFSNTVEEGLAVLIKDGFVVSVEKDDGTSFPTDTRIVDAGGEYLCPGFIDSHTHLDGVYPFRSFVPYAIKGGTTTVITECAMIATSCGMEAVEAFIASTRGYPVRSYFLAPPLTPPFPTMETAKGLTFREFSRLLKREDCVGIGEAYWTRIVEGDDRLLRQAALAMSLRKRLDGHAAGARGRRLTEYVLTGITSCHESVNMDEVVEKLRHGLYVMVREGFVRRELPELHRIKDLGADTRRIILASDFFDPVMLCEEGYLDSIVRRAIGYGFDPIEAIKMVTINPADYYGLRCLGAIAPLRKADILFLRDLKDVSTTRVMADGEIVYEGGEFLKVLPDYRYPETVMHSIETEPLSEEDFHVRAPSLGPLRMRVIEIANPTITREKIVDATVRNGFVEKDLKGDILPVAVISRGKRKQMGRGFIKGSGIRNGAIATNFIWDSCNILVLGSNERDMAIAANRLIKNQGGFAIAQDGKVAYEFPMPVFGLIPSGTMEELKEKTKELERAVRQIGSEVDKPVLLLQTIPFTGLPFLRISDRGLADIKNRKLVPLFV
jgi:adenine deaminase